MMEEYITAQDEDYQLDYILMKACEPTIKTHCEVSIVSPRLTLFYGKPLVTLQLSSFVFKIPNDPYTTLSQNLISYSTLSQFNCLEGLL